MSEDLGIQRALAAYQGELAPRGITFRARQGLNTGLVVVGSIGGDLRMDYTAVGDTTNVAARLQQAFPVAMLYDADVFRAFIEIIGLLALPQEVLSRPGMAERIMKVAGDHDDFVMPGPSRAEVLSILNDQDAGPSGPSGQWSQRGQRGSRPGGRPA